MKDFEARLKGGHPNSLGNTIEVVEEVFKDQNLFEELFNCYFSDDEIVRLRVSNAMKRICKVQPKWLLPYISRFINEISKIDQASTKWTLADLFGMLSNKLSEYQLEEAKSIIKHNLDTEDDWIVLNSSMQTLAEWSQKDAELKEWLLPRLEKLSGDKRKSVSKRAIKIRSTI